jgi:hypothetical protein
MAAHCSAPPVALLQPPLAVPPREPSDLSSSFRILTNPCRQRRHRHPSLSLIPCCSAVTNTFSFVFSFELERAAAGAPIPPKRVLPASGVYGGAWFLFGSVITCEAAHRCTVGGVHQPWIS